MAVPCIAIHMYIHTIQTALLPYQCILTTGNSTRDGHVYVTRQRWCSSDKESSTLKRANILQWPNWNFWFLTLRYVCRTGIRSWFVKFIILISRQKLAELFGKVHCYIKGWIICCKLEIRRAFLLYNIGHLRLLENYKLVKFVFSKLGYLPLLIYKPVFPCDIW